MASRFLGPKSVEKFKGLALQSALDQERRRMRF